MWKWPESTQYNANWRGIPDPVTGEVVWHEAHYPYQWDSETREYWGVTWEEPPAEEPQGPNYSIPKKVWLDRVLPEEMERFYGLLASGNSLAAQIMTGMLAWTEIDVDKEETFYMLVALGAEGFFGEGASQEYIQQRIENLLSPL